MHRLALVLLVVFLVVSGGVGLTVAIGSSPEPAQQSGETPPAVTSVEADVQSIDQEFDRTTFDVRVSEDGTAHWTFEYERPLTTEDEEREFEAFAETFETEETDLYVRFTDQAQALVSSGTENTDREMSATEFERSATIEGEINTMGVVRMSFTWENFARADGDRIVVSDVFDGGFFLMSDQALTIRAGDGLAFDTVRPDAQYAGDLHQASSVTWMGERDFAHSHPYVVLVADDSVGSQGGIGTLPGGPTLAGGIVLAGLFGLLAYLWYRPNSAPEPIAGIFEAVSRSDPTTDDRSGAAEGTAAVGSSHAADGPSSVELMSDEDRVRTLIEENGGRMKQVQIVEQTDWSKSKVSMLLSEMEDEGSISKLRVGRENIISLDGFEPEAAQSPFDE